MARTTIASLAKMKVAGEKIASITAYDASFSALFADCGMDFMLVGDSLGMTLQGEDSTVPVTTEQVVYHTKSVRKGAPEAFVIADMPFMTYATPTDAYEHAAKLMRAGANMVKLEGGDWLISTIKGLHERGVPVCAHLGLLPQSVNVLGGYKVQGREQSQADATLRQALALQEAGAQLLVLECVPNELAKRITDALDIPTIGIGAGPATDGQILVMHDMLGITSNYMPKFVKNYLTDAGNIRAAVEQYVAEVKNGDFPQPEHSFS